MSRLMLANAFSVLVAGSAMADVTIQLEHGGPTIVMELRPEDRCAGQVGADEEAIRACMQAQADAESDVESIAWMEDYGENVDELAAAGDRAAQTWVRCHAEGTDDFGPDFVRISKCLEAVWAP